MGKIIMLMGRSGSGKDTLFKHVLIKEEFKKYQMKEIVLHTTRPVRNGELDGVEYFFNTEEEMNILESTGKIVERRHYDTMHGVWYYFTCQEQIDIINNNYITVNTLEAYDQFLNHYDSKVLLPIYINVDERILLQRAINRENEQKNPKYQELCRRFLADSDDFSLENLKKRNITNIVDNNFSIEESLN